jgi:hypothetical protein
VFVERLLPPRERMKGARFWEEGGDKAVAFDAAVKARLDTVKAWLADPRDKPVYELLIDEQTDVFVNGWSKPPHVLRPGDCVGVCYATASEKTHQLRPLQLRAYRFP